MYYGSSSAYGTKYLKDKGEKVSTRMDGIPKKYHSHLKVRIGDHRNLSLDELNRIMVDCAEKAGSADQGPHGLKRPEKSR